ncbi:MAG: hypothetical protein IPI23_21620 [Bacteroidetes bacterium]|nr:hypothetical protein [Bacteroidota bacterium]
MLTKYETEKKETEILKLNSDKKIQQLQLEKQKALLTGNILAARQKQQEIDLLNQKQQIQELKLAKQKEALTLKELEAETNSRKLQLTQQEKQLKSRTFAANIFEKLNSLGCFNCNCLYCTCIQPIPDKYTPEK